MCFPHRQQGWGLQSSGATVSRRISRLNVGTQLYYDSDAWQVLVRSATARIIAATQKNFEFRIANFELRQIRTARDPFRLSLDQNLRTAKSAC